MQCSPHATALDSSVGDGSPHGTDCGRSEDHSSPHASEPQVSHNAEMPSKDGKASTGAGCCTQEQQSAVAALQLQVADLTAGREEDQRQMAENAAAMQELRT